MEHTKSGSKTIHRQHDDWDEVHNQLLNVQKKSLEISDPNDADEKEADEVARKVVENKPSAGESVINRSPEKSGESIQRKTKEGMGMAPMGMIEVWFHERGTTLDDIYPDSLDVLNSYAGSNPTQIVGGSSLFNEIRHSKILQLPKGQQVDAFNMANYQAAQEANARASTIHQFFFGSLPANNSTIVSPNAIQAAVKDYSTMANADQKPFIQEYNKVRIIL